MADRVWRPRIMSTAVRGEEGVWGAVVHEEDTEDIFGPLEGVAEVVVHALEGELRD